MEAPSVEEAHLTYGESVDFYGVAWNGSTEYMLEFIDRHGITFPSLLDIAGDVFARYEVPYQPAWVFIDAGGAVTKVQGSLDRDSLEPLIADLIANS